MKVILISEALDEPFEMDSNEPNYQSTSDPPWWFARGVFERVEGLMRAEQMRKAPGHGLFT